MNRVMLLPLLVLLVGCARGTSKEEHARYVQCDTAVEPPTGKIIPRILIKNVNG